MVLVPTFDDSAAASDPDGEIRKNIWDRFLSYYDFIGNCGFFVKYPNFWYYLQGLVSPRQIIAWRKLIKIIGVGVFNKITLLLNYNFEDDKILFLEKFKKDFPNPTKLIITFTCGYFWRFLPNENKRRTLMKDFVRENIKNGCKVNIFTQDDTIKKEINSDIGRGKKPCIKCRLYRMDIHSTIVEPRDKKEKGKTLLFIELPHTELTAYRLEACVTIDQLREFGCKEKQIKKLLRFLKRQHYLVNFITKSIPSYKNLALNFK